MSSPLPPPARSTTPVLAVAALLAVGGPACKDEVDPCTALDQRMQECLEPEGSKADRLRTCRDRLAGEDEALATATKTRIACAEKSDCVAFEDCLAAAAKARAARRTVAEIEQALQRDTLQDAYDACVRVPTRRRDEEHIRTLCSDVRERIVAQLAAGSLSMRCPAPRGTFWFDKGVVLEHCQQQAHGRFVRETVAKAEARLEPEGTDAPVTWLAECTEAMQRLQALDMETPWSREALRSVTDACFVRLAPAVIAASPEDERCQGNTAVLYEQVRSLGLRLPWIAELRTQCGFGR